MTIPPFFRTAMLLAAGAAIARCTGPNAVAPSTATPQRVSWTADGLGPQNLLYVANSNGLVNVYHYWQRTLVGVLTNFSRPMGECTDTAQDVYITDYGAGTVVEYAHGASTPIRTIQDPDNPYGCAVDPTTGDLAIANHGETVYSSYDGNSGNVEIYKHAKGKPVVYGKDDGAFTTLAYDDYGDLLVTDLDYYYFSFNTTYFYYLPKNGTQLLKIDLPNDKFTSSSRDWPSVQSINYDGTYWVVTADNIMYRYTIGVKAEEIDDYPLTGAPARVGEIYLYRKGRKGQATQVVAGAEPYDKSNVVDYWKYPVSADPFASITNELDSPYGVAISLRTAK